MLIPQVNSVLKVFDNKVYAMKNQYCSMRKAQNADLMIFSKRKVNLKKANMKAGVILAAM
jgi:uridine kinase